MSIAQAMLAEFEHEAKITRKFLERIPQDKLMWKPHDKSHTAGELALHIANVPGNVVRAATLDESPVPDFTKMFQQPMTVQEILVGHEKSISTVREILPTLDDAKLMTNWSAMLDGKPVMTNNKRIPQAPGLAGGSCAKESAMKTNEETAINFPKLVDQAEWQKAHDALLLKEKAATKARDALAAERRRLPMVKIEKNYTFTGPDGQMSLLDLFEGRRQLILYHFMFAPTVKGWPDAGCVGCSMVTDTFGHPAHLQARDTSFCLVSLAPLKNIEKFKKRMGWNYPWYSSEGTDFNKDLGLTTDKGENYGLSVFIHGDEDNVYRTYFTNGRGVEGLNIWTFLDLTPLGRLEDWEDSPTGGPRTKPYVWWRRHDEYGTDGQ